MYMGTLALTGQRAGTGPAPTLAAGWHGACPYIGGPYTGGITLAAIH